MWIPCQRQRKRIILLSEHETNGWKHIGGSGCEREIDECNAQHRGSQKVYTCADRQKFLCMAPIMWPGLVDIVSKSDTQLSVVSLGRTLEQSPINDGRTENGHRERSSEQLEVYWNRGEGRMRVGIVHPGQESKSVVTDRQPTNACMARQSKCKAWPSH